MGSRRAGIHAASKSSIEIAFPYRGQWCRERISLPPTDVNLKKAAAHRTAILVAIEQGTFDYATTFPNSKNLHKFVESPGEILSVKDYLNKWLRDQAPYLKASTWNGYRKIINGKLIPALGKHNLADLKRKHVKQWVATLNVTAKTQGNIVSPLRIALDDALDDELIEINPLSGWKIKQKKTRLANKKDPIDPFSQEERKAILATLSGQNKNMVQFLFWTGLRTSELCALNWNDIDFIRKTVRIDKALTQVAKEEEETKTAAGTRDIKLLPAALDALQNQKQHTFLKNEEVFQNPRTNDRWTGDQPIRKTMWTSALKKAGVRYRYPYQCRHTYASMMLMAGESAQWVATQVGHTDWSFTARTYTRFIPEDAPDAGSKAVEKFGKPSANMQKVTATNNN
jgi:integrase